MKPIVTSSSINPMNSNVTDYTQSIIPILWKFLEKGRRPCFMSMNVYTNDNELVISIINSRKIKRFSSPKNIHLAKMVSHYLKV